MNYLAGHAWDAEGAAQIFLCVALAQDFLVE